MQEKKQATLGHALIPIVVLIASLSISIIVFGADPHIPILFSVVVTGLVGIFMLGMTWKDLESGMINTIKMGMQAVLILMVIGTVIGTWILSGTVPTMIYYGLTILSPGIFLVATVLICSIVSLATGSSWTTAGTIGIALIGIGGGLGIPLPIVAGAIVSGAYFGDKMSPLSDTTNLASGMAGADLFDHIKYMLYTTIPAYLIALILYGIVGARFGGATADVGEVNAILGALSGTFVISPLLLIPPAFVIVIVVLKIPALPGLLAGTFLGGILAAFIQKASLGDIIDAAHYGFYADTGVEVVDELISKGGLDSMMWTISLILLALALGGLLEKTGILQVIADSILKVAKNTGSLIAATMATSIVTNLLTADQYLALVLPGRMFKEAYDKKGLHPKLLSRTLEGSGTVTSPLIPWNTCGATMFAVLTVNPLAFFPYAFFNLLVPIANLVYAFLGIKIAKAEAVVTE